MNKWTHAARVRQLGVQNQLQCGVIFDRHYDRIHRYLRRRAGEALADDLAAQAFTEAFAQRKRYDMTRSDARTTTPGKENR